MSVWTEHSRPAPGAADFNDSQWDAIDPTTLDMRRAGGRLCFNWYRIKLRIPERVGNFDTAGSTAVFEVVVDDYAEVWVDGKLAPILGQSGGQVVKGFNAPNRVIISHNAQPGQEIQLAVFGINGPISVTPRNFIWVKSATLEFYKDSHAVIKSDAGGQIVRLDPTLEDIVPCGRKNREVGQRISIHRRAGLGA